MKDWEKKAAELGKQIKGVTSPPTTFEQVKKAINDVWDKDIKPLSKKLDRNIIKAFNKIEEGFTKLISSSKTQETLSKGFDSLINSIDDGMAKQSAVFPKLKDFLKSSKALAAAVAESLHKDPGTLVPAWSKFLNSASALKSTIKSEVKQVIHGIKQVASRSI